MARVVLLLFYFSSLVTGYHIWASPDDLPDTIPESCRSALSQNLTCSGGLIKADSLGAGSIPDVWTLSDYCQPDCLSSLEVSACKTLPCQEKTKLNDRSTDFPTGCQEQLW
jgi:hypothetical protein